MATRGHQIGVYRRVLLWVIVLLAVVLRFVNLNKVPVSLYWEEAALGYDAYSIYKTGRDFHGNSWPIVAFESFGDWKPALYFYATAIFMPVFGLSTWSVRLPSAIAGVGLVLLVYLIVKELNQNESVALISAFVLAIMPWHIQFSRAGFEVNLATTLLGLGVLGLLKGVEKKWWYFVSVTSLSLAMYTYHGLRLLGPLVALLFVCCIGNKYVKKSYFWVGVLLAGIMLWPLIGSLNSEVVNDRFKETSVFSVSNAIEVTNQLREEDGNIILSRLVHHRYWYWGKEVIDGMFKHFSVKFLLFGDDNARHQTGFYGPLYKWMIVPFYWGMVEILRKRNKNLLIILGWILLAAIPPALTKTTPHTLRFLPAAPAIAMVIAVGVMAIWANIKRLRWKNILVVLLVGIISLEFSAYLYDYYQTYSIRSSREWQYGYEELMNYLSIRKLEYDNIYITREHGRPSIYAMFYWQVDPKSVQRESKMVKKDQGELLELDNVKFGATDISSNSLVISDKEIETGKLLKEINFLNGDTAFLIYEI